VNGVSTMKILVGTTPSGEFISQYVLPGWEQLILA